MYVPQKLVSNHSRLFLWKFLIGSALLCFPLAYCIVQISVLKLLDSLRRLDLQMWCWIFSLWFSMMSINNVLLCFARASYFVQVSVMKMFKSSIEYSLQNSTFNSFTVVPMEVSCKRSAALVFAGFLYRSSLNIESFREFWKTTLANLILNFSLLLSLMSINNVLLCCSRASFSVSSRDHEVVQIFYTICSAKLSFKSFTICSDASLLSAQRCFAFRLLPILFKSQYWNS